jgi:hypothetical protein
MRKWKDEGPPQMKELTKASMIFLGITNAFTVLWIFVSQEINAMQIFGLVSSVVLIYMMRTGKVYKIIRAYVDWQTRKKDNKWR